MNTNNFKGKFRSALIVIILLFSVFLMMLTYDPVIPEAKAVDFWKQTSKNDFKEGTRENVTIVGSGDAAALQLLLYNYWEDKSPAPKPTFRYAHEMTTIFGTEEILLFGGADNNQDTWIYDLRSNTWTEKFPNTRPMGRQYYAMTAIYDTDNVLIFGGINWGLGRQNDTWIYDYSSNRWLRKYQETYPSERGHAAMTYVYGTDKVVLFGGSDFGIGYLSDTWNYDYTDNIWNLRTPSSKPIARHGHAMAPVFGTDQVILFGGFRDRTYSDTWLYDLSDNTWELQSPDASPSPRTGHTMVSIYGDDKVLLYGGTDDEIYYDDTWVYDLSDNLWTKRPQTTKPIGRSNHGMAAICEDDKAVIFGGSNASKDLVDTWVYHNAVYSQTGDFTSAPFDAGRATPFGTISWNTTLTSNTTIKIQLRSAALKTELDSEAFVGPDGTEYTYYTSSPGEIWSGHNNDRWVQYKAQLWTTDEDETPKLKDVTISYNVRPGPPILTGPANDTWLIKNNPKFTWKYNGSQSSLPGGFQLQIDENSDFTSIDYDSNIITSGTNSYTHPNLISDRIWYWRLRTKDYDGFWGPYNEYSILKIDTTIFSPLNVKVTPSHWSSKNEFTVDWTTPDDLSGIKKGAFYFISETLPNSQADGTWTDEKPFKITNAAEGINTIHIWLIDDAGNLNYENCTSATFKLDTKSPIISHKPITKVDEGKKILINAEITDKYSGVDQAYLYYKKSKDIKYSYIQMDKIGKNFSAVIPGVVVTTNGLGYFIKVTDKASPNNVVYYGKGGLAENEPNKQTDFDISISKKEEGISNIYWLIGGLAAVIIIIIIIVAFYILKNKKPRASSRTLDFSGETMDNRIPMPPAQPQGQYTPPQRSPVSYQTQPAMQLAPQPMRPIPPMPPPMPPAQPKVLVVYNCEACDATLTDPNNCPYCGWSR